MSKHRFATFYCGCALALEPATSALAEDAAPSDTLQEVVVTAQKRLERLKDVPMSISVASGDLLAKQKITDTSELQRIVPGFSYQRSSYGVPIYSLRGIGFYDTSVGVSPAVSVYLDQVPLPYSVMSRGVILDLERVEVLKGPQGTLFGQNSTGGALNYIPARPSNRSEAALDVTYGRFNEVSTEGFLSGALLDKLTARISARYEYRDPWQQQYAANAPKFGQDPDSELGRRRFSTERLLLDWTPSDRLRVELNLNGWQDNSDTQGAQFVRFAPQVPLNPFNAATYNAFVNTPPAVMPVPADGRLAGWNPTRRPESDAWFYQSSLKAELDLPADISFTSISGYSRYGQDTSSDTNGVPYPDVLTGQDANIRSFSQELRLAGTLQRLRWLVGGNFASDLSNERQTNTLGSSNNGVGPFRYREVRFLNRQDSRTWAAFASLDYSISETLTLQGSARYTKQDRDFAGCAADPGDGLFAAAFHNIFGTATAPGGCVTMSDPVGRVLLPIVSSVLDQSNAPWRAGLSWKPDADTLVYANITKGFKAGSFPVLPGVFATQFDPVTQESVLAYETGFKISPSRVLEIDGAAFYYDYRNKQLLGTTVILPFGNLPKLVNIPRSRVAGAELQAIGRPTDALRLSAGATYVASRVQENPSNPVDQFGIPTSFVGDAFPNTPRWQLTADAEYRFTVAQSASAYLGASVASRSRTQAAFDASPEFEIHSYTLLDLRAGVDFGSGYHVQVWGRNVTNRYYVNNISHLIDVVSRTTGMPATYGITVGVRY